MAHKVIEQMHQMKKDLHQKLNRARAERQEYADELHRKDKLINELEEQSSHLSAVIQLAEKGTFIDPPGPAKTEEVSDEAEALAAIEAVPVQRLREGSSAKD